jgi:uroporphyrinogen-III synthase
MNAPLAGKVIVVTRPAHQSAALAEGIRAAGGEALLFPALEIVPVDTRSLAPLLSRLSGFDMAIFISPNAARFGMAAIRESAAMPENIEVFAVGPGTAKTLETLGLSGVTVPPGQDSEALLALPQLQQVTGKRIAIFRGVGGRPLLADTLRARGATVDHVECYRRRCPDADAGPLLQRWTEVSAVTIASAETLHNLATLLGDSGTGRLRATPLFVPHAKIAEAARMAGMTEVIVTTGGDAGLLQGLINWFREHP